MESKSIQRAAFALTAAVSLALVFGCSDDDDNGANPCDGAIEKIKSCGFEVTGDVDCKTEQDKCQARCIRTVPATRSKKLLRRGPDPS